MRALIFEGQIVAVAVEEFPVHPSMQWTDAPDDAAIDTHIVSGGKVIPRPPPPQKTQAEIDAEASEAEKRELIALDLASIRDLRAWVAAQATAPQTLKDREAAAVAARARVKQ